MPHNVEDNSSDQKAVDNSFDWLTDHGQMSYEELINLANKNTAESIERLHQLADDNNISYDETTDMVQLAEEISRAIETDSNDGVE